MINYPNKPWADGQEFTHTTEDGSLLIAKYELSTNTWTFRPATTPTSRPPIFSDQEPTLNPGLPDGEQDLVPGDIWYDTTDPDNIVRYVYDGNQWLVYNDDFNFSITTRDVQTIPRDTYARLAELAEMDPVDDLLKTQEDVNDFIALVSERSLRGLQRTTDNVDFLQNTVASGAFRRVLKSPEPPLSGSCYMLQDGGAESNHFDEVQNLLIAKDGLGPYGTFEDVKPGDTLSIQNDDNANFGVYVVTSATELNLAWDFSLEVAKGRAVGNATEIGKLCRVRVARPVYTLASDTPPQFSESGQLWYDTASNRLFVWDEENGQFYDVGGEGGGGGNMDDYLPLAGGSMTGDIAMAQDTAIAGTNADGTKFANLRFDGGYVKYLGFKGDDNALATQGDIPDTSTFLPLTGGTVTGKLTANNFNTTSINTDSTQNLIIKHNGNSRISVEDQKIIMAKPVSLFAEGTENSHAVTKGYVDSVASGGSYVVPEWSWINVLWDNASSGQFGMIDRNNQSTSRFADCRGIWWKGTDRSGNKAFNDSGWVDWSGYFPGPLYIQRDGQNIFRVAQASGLNTWVMFDYVRDMDLYFIGWTEAGLGTALGGYTGVSNGGIYGLLIPELAF